MLYLSVVGLGSTRKEAYKTGSEESFMQTITNEGA